MTTAADLRSKLDCQMCGNMGVVMGSHAEHDSDCDGSCRNCPVEVPHEEPCPDCGEAQAPIYWGEARALVNAANAIYDAGFWSCDRAVDARGLWENLRNALGREPGTSPMPIGGAHD